MLIKLVSTDILKYKRNFLWKFVIIAPLITTLIMQLVIVLQFDSINEFSAENNINGWMVLISQNCGPVFWPSITNIIIMVISIMVYQIEFKDNSMNTQMCLPVSKSLIILSKFLVIYIFALIAILINLLGMIMVGIINSISDRFPCLEYGKYLLTQCCSIIGIVSISNWISSLFKNPLIPYITGILGFIMGLLLPFEFKTVSYFVPYSYPLYACGMRGYSSSVAVIGGFVSGVFFIGASIFEFINRDIK
jgi:hypothetical protein